MEKTENRTNKEIVEPFPLFEQYNQSQEEYIRSLEMSLQLLQREVENLRSQLKPPENHLPSYAFTADISILSDAASIFQNCKEYKEVLSILHDRLSKQYSLTESNMFFFGSTSSLKPISDSETSLTLSNIIKYFEEEGIIEWAVEKRSASIIPNLEQNPDEAPTFFILVPLFLRGNAIGIFAARTDRNHQSFTDHELNSLTIIAEYAAIALDNIRSIEEISNINRRLSALNKQMIDSSRLASVGELAASIAREISTPLQIIKANLQLLESGLGDTPRRIEIIKEQTERIEDINTRISNIAEIPVSDFSPVPLNLCSIIDEVLLFSGSQLQRDGIRIEKIYDDLSLDIIGFKHQIEQVFLNLFLRARDSMPDGGIITIGVFKGKYNKVLITIADNGTGIQDDNLTRLFEPYYSSEPDSKTINTGLFLTKNLIEQHKGTISVFSEIGKGTTFKVIFPIFKK